MAKGVTPAFGTPASRRLYCWIDSLLLHPGAANASQDFEFSRYTNAFQIPAAHAISPTARNGCQHEWPDSVHVAVGRDTLRLCYWWNGLTISKQPRLTA